MYKIKSLAMKTALRVIGQQSTEISGADAQDLDVKQAWCPECSKSVHLIRKGKNGWPEAHFEHDDRNEAKLLGCSRTTKP